MRTAARWNGVYVPNQQFGKPGRGMLWLTGETNASNVRERLQRAFGAIGDVALWSEKDDPQMERFSQPGAVVVDEDTYFRAVAEMAARDDGKPARSLEFSLLSAAPSLAWQCHLFRLAVDLVARGDVLACAAPAGSRWTDMYAACFELAQSGDESLGLWRSAVGEYAAAWVPAWCTPRLRALRNLWLNQAEEMVPVTPEGWTARHAGEQWLWRAVDWVMRRWGRPKLTDGGQGGTSYRVMYRGEEDMLRQFAEALHSSENRFFADGWLIWRTLRQGFATSGWRREWLEDASGKSYYHVELELTPPKEHVQAEWTVQIYIAHNEWNARRPLADWWTTPSRHWRVGREMLFAPDTWFLPQLLAAAAVWPELAEALARPGVSFVVLSPDDVYSFLTERLPALEELGIPVRYPDISTHPLSDIRIKVRVQRTHRRQQRTSSAVRERWFSAEQLVDFDWTVALGDVELPAETFEQMVARGTPFVQVGGSWKLIPMQAILKQLEQLRAGRGAKSLNAVQFTRAVLLAEGETEGAAVDVEFDQTATDARQVLRALLRAHTPVLLEPPSGFRGTLRAYQRLGYAWLAHLRSAGCGAVLADDMGLGKTIQVLAYLLHLKETRAAEGVHLLICPTSLVANWRTEIQRFAPELRVYVHHGAHRHVPAADGRSPLEVARENCDVVLTTYATVVRDAELLQALAWDAVIADEAQNIKNPETKQARAVHGLHAIHRIALTGTPMENRLEELWSIVQFVNPGYLGSLTWFRQTFAIPIAQREQAAARRLQRLLHPLLLRRSKSDPAIQLELPEKWEFTQYAALTAEQAALYQSVVDQLFTGLPHGRSMSRRGQILASLVRLKQVCDHPCLLQGGRATEEQSGKLRLLLDLLETVLAEGEAALVFTQFREMGWILCDAMAQRFGWRPQFLHGGLGAVERGQMVDRFQRSEDPAPVLVLSLKAGGVGLNLTRANHVFHYDRWWNPAVEDQATDRAYRIGQVRDVQVHKLICPGTLEERIDTLIQSKRTLSSAIVGQSEQWLTELDNETLRSLFELDVKAAMEAEAWASDL